MSSVQDSMENRNEVDNINENEVIFQTEESEEDTLAYRKKRLRVEDESETWTLVARNSKRKYRKNLSEKSIDEEDGKIEVCITSKEKIPKRIELARCLKDENILNIIRVKYATPYKIFVLFEEENEAEKLINSTIFQEKGWKCYKTSEVGTSYGIIRDIDLNLSEKDVQTSITSNFEIISVKRLFRRNNEIDGWTESETVRLSFKGSSLPPYIFIYGLKVKVEPYIFPVTQCSKCWRFGHTHRFCPSKHIICPKCTKYHNNCDINHFKCINCGGPHMSLERTCPIYVKEKRIRQLMAEFNCTYRRALTMYVPPSPIQEDKTNLDPIESFPVLNSYQDVNKIVNETQSYSEIVKSSKKTINNENKKNKQTKRRTKTSDKSNQSINSMDWDTSSDSEQMNVKVDEKTSRRSKEKPRQDCNQMSFSQLVEKLKNVIFVRNISLKEKIVEALSFGLGWLISYFKAKILELPILNNILESFYG